MRNYKNKSLSTAVYSPLVIAVRVSGGHLCKAEASTEPAGETSARRAAIRSLAPASLRAPLGVWQSVFPFKGYYGFFRAYHSCGAQKLFSLGARTTFDRGARRCSLYPAPQALATSLRMTRRTKNATSLAMTKYLYNT